MFVYEKKLQYPVRIKNCNPKLASVIISQYGGPYPVSLCSSKDQPTFRRAGPSPYLYGSLFPLFPLLVHR